MIDRYNLGVRPPTVQRTASRAGTLRVQTRTLDRVENLAYSPAASGTPLAPSLGMRAAGGRRFRVRLACGHSHHAPGTSRNLSVR